MLLSGIRGAISHLRSSLHSVGDSATPHPSIHAIFPATAAALWLEMSVPPPTEITRRFWSGTNGPARQSDRLNRANETIRNFSRQRNPCGHKSANVRLRLAHAQNRPCPSTETIRFVPRSSPRLCWIQAPPPSPARTSPLIRRGWRSTGIHAGTLHSPPQ